MSQRWQDRTSIFRPTWLSDMLFFMCGHVVSSFLPLSPPPHPESCSEYDNHLKTNYLLTKLISVSQQGAAGSRWACKCCCLVNGCLSLGSGSHTETAAAPGSPFTLISCLQLALADLSGFIHRIVTYSH